MILYHHPVLAWWWEEGSQAPAGFDSTMKACAKLRNQHSAEGKRSYVHECVDMFFEFSMFLR